MVNRRPERPLEEAVAYAKKGWPVFPCHSPVGAGCSCRSPDCGSPGKHPRVQGGCRSATADVEQVQRWWKRWPSANVGIATGRASGLVVVDIDPDHGGTDSMRRLVGEHGSVPRGPVVGTGSGGWHLYFRHPVEEVRNSAGLLGPGVDVRGEGGYVIGPPSRHASGGVYRWRTPVPALPEMPDWLVDAVARRPLRELSPHGAEPGRIDRDLSAWARTALLGEANRVRTAPMGQRNHTLNRAAFSLGQIVGTGVLAEDTVERVLSESAVAAGLGDRESIRTIRSGLSAGRQHPRRPVERDLSALGPVEYRRP